MRIRLAALVTVLALSLSVLASAHWVDEPVEPPVRDASAELQAVLQAAQPDLVACAFPLGRPDPARAGLQLVVSLDARARLRVRVAQPELARGPAASCLTRVVRRAVGRARPRLLGPVEQTLTPFAALPQPTPPPASPTVLDRPTASALFAALRADPDDTARLARLAGEVANGRVIPASAVAFLGSFRVRKVEGALAMCGILIGDDVRARLASVLPAAHRAFFLAVTEAGCGVPVPEGRPLPVAPPPPECSVDSDCVLIPRAPPSCCGNSCRGGVSVPRAAAESLSAACAERRPTQCPAMACAYEPGFPACVSGQCTTRSGRGPLPSGGFGD